jgi:lysophospholipase L1-like esterase
LEPHPIYGNFHIPNTTSWLWADEYITRVDINSRGLREREIDYEKPANVRRVVVLGDSFVEGSEVQAEATLTRRLEALLSTGQGQTVQVVNAGVMAYGTGQEYLLLKHEALRYHPDLVVVVFFTGNDVADNSYRIDWQGELHRRPFFVITDRGELRQLPFQFEPRQDEGWLERLHRESLLFGKLETVELAKLSPPALAAGGSGHGDEVGDRLYVQNTLGVFSESSTGPWEEAWQVTEALLEAMREQAAANGAGFLLVNAPTPFEVYPDHWDNLLRRYELPATGWDLDGPNRRLAAIAARQGIRYLDLRPALREAAAAGPRLYYRYDGHWTAAGHELAARTLAGALADGQLLAGR